MNVFSFLIVLAFMVFVFLVVVIVAIVSAISRRRGDMKLSHDEESQFQQLWTMGQKMEERIANLETILMQRERAPETGKKSVEP